MSLKFSPVSAPTLDQFESNSYLSADSAGYIEALYEAY